MENDISYMIIAIVYERSKEIFTMVYIESRAIQCALCGLTTCSDLVGIVNWGDVLYV